MSLCFFPKKMSSNKTAIKFRWYSCGKLLQHIAARVRENTEECCIHLLQGAVFSKDVLVPFPLGLDLAMLFLNVLVEMATVSPNMSKQLACNRDDPTSKQDQHVRCTHDACVCKTMWILQCRLACVTTPCHCKRNKCHLD